MPYSLELDITLSPGLEPVEVVERKSRATSYDSLISQGKTKVTRVEGARFT